MLILCSSANYLPEPKRFGRPRTTDLRIVVDALLDILSAGCQWRMLPKDFAEAGYSGPVAAGKAAGAGLKLKIVKRPPHAEGFEVIPRRRVIERIFGWLGRNRR